VICAEPGDAPTGEEAGDLLLDFDETVNVLEGQLRDRRGRGRRDRANALIAKEGRSG